MAMRFHLRLLAAVGLLLLSLTGLQTVQAQEASVKLVTGNFAPYSGAALPAGGLATDLLEHIFAYAGRPIEIEFLPWKRGYEGVISQNYDATFPYAVTAERQRVFRYSAPLYAVSGYAYAAPDSAFDAKSISDLKGKRLCRPLGYSIPARFKPYIDEGSIQITKTQKIEDSLRMLTAGRCDFVLWNKQTATRLTKALPGGLKNLRALDVEIAPATFHVIIAKDHPRADSLIEVVNSGLAYLKKQGTHQRIIQFHLER